MTATDQDTMVCGCFSRYLCVESMIFCLHALRAIGGPEPPPPRTIQNVNGIHTELNWIEWRTQMRALKELQVDGFSFTETNLKWTPEQIKEA
eukprot:scaffold9520_cov45-Attheya_sp.AAC.4